MAFSKACTFCNQSKLKEFVIVTADEMVLCEDCLKRATGVMARGGGDGVFMLVERGAKSPVN